MKKDITSTTTKTKQQYYQDELNRITDPKLRASLEKWWLYKKGKYEEIGWQSQITIVLKFPSEQVIDRIEEAIASGWQGMNLDKITTNGKKTASTEFFGLLAGYNEEIQIKTRNKLKDYSGFQKKEASPDVVRTYLNEAIVDYEKVHMPEESKKLVREMSETWRKDNNLSSYQEVPNSIIVEFIKKVKEN